MTETKEEQKPYCAWDTCEQTIDQRDYLMETVLYENRIDDLELDKDSRDEIEALIAKFELTLQSRGNFADWLETNSPGWHKRLEDIFWQQACEDGDKQEWYFSDLCEALGALMQQVREKSKLEGTKWLIKGRNMGWRHRSGYKYTKADNDHEGAKELIEAILPNTDCTYAFYDNGTYIGMRNAHHDAPTGEWYDIYPLADHLEERTDMNPHVPAMRDWLEGKPSLLGTPIHKFKDGARVMLRVHEVDKKVTKLSLGLYTEQGPDHGLETPDEVFEFSSLQQLFEAAPITFETEGTVYELDYDMEEPNDA